MAFFRSYIAPFLIVVIFAIALLAVSARIFLPSDMLAPAPVGEGTPPVVEDVSLAPAATDLPPALSELIHGQISPLG